MDGNLFLDELFGAEISYHSVEEYNGKRKELIEGAMEGVRRVELLPGPLFFLMFYIMDNTTRLSRTIAISIYFGTGGTRRVVVMGGVALQGQLLF